MEVAAVIWRIGNLRTIGFEGRHLQGRTRTPWESRGIKKVGAGRSSRENRDRAPFDRRASRGGPPGRLGGVERGRKRGRQVLVRSTNGTTRKKGLWSRAPPLENSFMFPHEVLMRKKLLDADSEKCLSWSFYNLAEFNDVLERSCHFFI